MLSPSGSRKLSIIFCCLPLLAAQSVSVILACPAIKLLGVSTVKLIIMDNLCYNKSVVKICMFRGLTFMFQASFLPQTFWFFHL